MEATLILISYFQLLSFTKSLGCVKSPNDFRGRSVPLRVETKVVTGYALLNREVARWGFLVHGGSGV
jgi:hypothetical protein